MKKFTFYLCWTLQIISALILFQTLFFKFSASEESVYIFTKIGQEPFGRIGVGIMELIASILLLIPSMSIFGAILGVGLMSGALFFHLTKLGIIVMNDGGYLFILCLIVLLSCSFILIINKEKIPYYNRIFAV